MAVRDILETIQTLEPGAKVRLIEVDCTEFGGDILRFHNYNVSYTEAELLAFQASGAEIPPKKIVWQGEEYSTWPYQISGIEWDGTGKSPQPALEVSNIDGSISNLCLQLQNLFGAKVTEHTTFQQYLPEGDDPDDTMEFTQNWYITRKSGENLNTVQFELSSPADFTGVQLPRRQIYSLCHWAMNNAYRGPDCGYTGTKYFTIKGEPTDNPALDQCGGLCQDCKDRFGADQPLPFGGFIGSSLIARG
jgi:lambda family phage minor tail protein L